MRFLKQALIGITAFSILLFLLSLLLSPSINVSKSVLLSASKEEIVAHLMDIKDWKNWNPLLQDSSLSYNFPSSTLVKWETAKGKTNAIELKQYAPDSIRMSVSSNNIPSFNSGFTVVSNSDGAPIVKLEWWISEELKWYPWEKFYGLFSESFRESYLENTLQAFKRYIESNSVSQFKGRRMDFNNALLIKLIDSLPTFKSRYADIKN